MNILINLAPLKAGGGQNVGMNLLSGLENLKDPDVSLFFYVSTASMIGNIVKEKYIDRVIEGPHNTIKRVLFERTKLGEFLEKNKIDIIYSCFGYAYVNKKYKQVCGMAESNIMFPEIDFWKEYSGIKKLGKDAIDTYRKWGYKRADALIFENEAMYKRTSKIFGSAKRSTYIKPSINVFDTDGEFVFDKKQEDSLVGLFLCGWQLNKNIMCIPELINKMNDLGRPIEIIITVNENDVNRVASTVKEFENVKNCYTLLYFMPGVPSVYYGSEWGIKGQKNNTDHDYPLRPCVDVSDIEDNELYRHVCRLGAVRRKYKALIL